MLSGSIGIHEPINEVGDKLYARYETEVKNIAKKHGLENLVGTARLPSDLRKRETEN